MNAPRKQNPERLGLLSLLSLVVGNAIGAGVYTTSGYALADLGSREWVMAAWVLGGVIALLGALSYGMLARGLAESGGEYLYLARSIHPLAGYIGGYVSLAAGFTGAIAFAAAAFEAYARAGFPELATLPPGALAMASILFGGAIHIGRTRAGARLHDAITGLMLLGIVGFMLWAGATFLAGVWRPSAPETFAGTPTLAAFAGSLVWVSLSYSGFNAAVYVAGEANNARRNVPLAMLLGTLIVLVTYVVLNAIFLYAPAPDLIAGQPEVAAIAAQAIGGMPMRRGVEVVIALSLLTSVTAMTLAGPRVYAKMAEDGALPAFFRSGANGPPRASIALQVGLALVVTAFAGIRDLLSFLGLVLSLCLALAVSSLFVRHARFGERPEGWAYPWAPALFIGATLLLAALSTARQPEQLAALGISVLVGAIAYFARRLWSPSASAIAEKADG